MLRDDGRLPDRARRSASSRGRTRSPQACSRSSAPQRVRDTPIAEEGFVGAAIGAAMLGLRPVVEIMTINFSLLALDQIVNHAAKIYGMFGGQCSVPMVIRTPGGGGQQLGATHSQNVELYYAFVPGLKVVAPSTPADAQGAAARPRSATTIRCCSWRTSRSTTPAARCPTDLGPAEIGRAAVTREGTDITIVGYSRMAHVAHQVAEQLAADGHLRRGRRPAQPPPARPRHDRRVGPPYRLRRRRRGRLAHLRDRRRDRRDDLGRRVRPARRPGAPRRRWPRCRCPTPSPSNRPRCRRPTPSSPPCATPSPRWADAADQTQRHPEGPARCPTSPCPASPTPWRRASSRPGARSSGDTITAGRRPRRDRDRQGDHGVRGLRRRRARARSSSHEGESAADRHADRGDRRRQRGRAHTAAGRRCGAPAEPAPAAAGCTGDRRTGGSGAGRTRPEPSALPRDGRPPASPLARRLARERGVDLHNVRGTGPHGRIIRADIIAFAQAAAATVARDARSAGASGRVAGPASRRGCAAGVRRVDPGPSRTSSRCRSPRCSASPPPG